MARVPLSFRRVANLGAVLLVGTAGGGAHELTRPGHERSLDPRETAVVAAARSLATPAAGPVAAETHCRVSLTLVEADSRKPIPGLVRVSRPGGGVLELPGLVNRGLKLRAGHPGKEWQVVTEPTVLLLPREVLRIEAFSGLETERGVLDLDLRGQSAVGATLPLRRLANPAAAGWRSGNTHLHLRGLSRAQADEYLQAVPRADGVELVFVSHLTRAGSDADYITNEHTRATLHGLASPGLTFGYGEEHRHNFGSGGEGYGHVLFLDLPELVHPVSVGAGIAGRGPDYPPLRRGIDQARGQGATIVWCHNAFGFEDVPGWISGRLHAHNIFDGGSQGTYERTYYRFLNLGLKVPFSTGTDWFIYDFSRVYVHLTEPFSVAAWLEGLRAGRTFITNGPLLELQAGGRAIGETVVLAGPERVPVRARAAARADFGALELVHDGRVVHQVAARAAGGHFVAELEHALPVGQSGWLAVRTSGGALDTGGPPIVPPGLPASRNGPGRNELGEALFAHTSALYLDVAGRSRFDPAAAQALIAEMEESLRVIHAKAQFDDDRQRGEVTGLYRDAIDQLRRRMKP